MTSISTIASSSGLQQQSIKKTNDKLFAAIASLVSGRNTQDVADVAVASLLQSQTAGLKQVSQNLAEGLSLTQVASGGIDQSRQVVDRLREIAQQSANGTTNDEQRKSLDQEFQSLVKQLDSIAKNTQFNGKNLLDGSLSGSNALSLNGMLSSSESDDNALSVDNLASNALFGGQSLNVLSAGSASQALSALGSATDTLTTAQATVGAFQETLNYAAASIDSAIANQEAAQSLLSDADFLQAATDSQQAQVQRNAQLSLAAQTNRLPAALLQLVS